MSKKESRQFNISVEGINCEMMYFEHLARLINASGLNTYNLKVVPKKMSPFEYAKRNAYKPIEKRNKKSIPFIHIQDIEDYYDESQRTKFFRMIEELRTTEEQFRISYMLGYSNYTFELWMLLHTADMDYAVQDRKAYLAPINQYFRRHYSNMDEFKQHNEFQGILDEFVTLDSIKLAIGRAKEIVENNGKAGKTKETYKGITFYHDNPDISVHEVIELIFKVCKVK